MKGNVLFYQGRRKVGNVVGYTRGGQQLFRAYQPIVDNPKTTKQMLQRAKIALLSSTGKAMASIVNFGFKGISDTLHSPRNIFAKKNYGTITGQNPLALTIDYERMVVADGGLYNAQYNAPSFSEARTVEVAFTWQPDEQFLIARDCPVLVAYCPEMNRCVIGDLAANMEDESASVVCPAEWQGLKVYVWAFTYRSTESGYLRTSPSVYLGFGNIS